MRSGWMTVVGRIGVGHSAYSGARATAVEKCEMEIEAEDKVAAADVAP